VNQTVQARAKIHLTESGEYLGVRANEFFLNDKNRKEKGKWDFEQQQISEIVLKAGNLVSTNALETALEFKISVVITRWNGEPIGILKALEDDSHIETRINQYKTVKNGMGIETAKKIVYAKLEGQNQVLRKYGLRQFDLMGIKDKINHAEGTNLTTIRKQLLPIEGINSARYFKQIFQLFPEWLRAEHRRTKDAYDGLNNLFNFGYSILFWKCYYAVLRAKLEPYMGFMHSNQFGKPSLVCDMQELYRYLIDDSIIQFAKNLRKTDFRRVYFGYANKRNKYPRLFLKKEKHRLLEKRLHDCFEVKTEIPRIKGTTHFKRQTIETLINEEVLLLAKYFRNETREWNPRIVKLN
jgi:CRISPR-associated protein Cas1